MDVTIKDCREKVPSMDSSSRLIVLHSVQLLPHQAYRDNEAKKYLRMLPSQETLLSIAVVPGITCELDFARFWSTRGYTKMKVFIQFRGVKPNNSSLCMVSAGGGANMIISSALRDEFVLPEAKLHTWRSPLNPIGEGIISPCDERDILPTGGKQIYQIILTYEFNQKEAGKVKPIVPTLQGFLYESEFESQLIQIFDDEKKLLGVTDSWPKEIDTPKGKISLRLQIRHDDTKLLNSCKDMSIFIERKLKEEIILAAHDSHESMVKGKTLKRRLLRKGTFTHVVFSEPAKKCLPSESKCGDILLGEAKFVNSSSLTNQGYHLSGTKVLYVLKDSPDFDQEDLVAKEPELEDKRSSRDKIQEKILNLRVDELKELSGDEFDNFYEEMVKDHPNHLPLLLCGLKHFDREEGREERLNKIVMVADQILSILNEHDLSLHFGVEYDREDAESCKVSKQCFSIIF